MHEKQIILSKLSNTSLFLIHSYSRISNEKIIDEKKNEEKKIFVHIINILILNSNIYKKN